MAKGDGGNNGGNQKNVTGISVSTTVAPEDMNNREKLAGLFTTLAFGALAMLGIAHVAPLIRTKLFRCEGEAPKGIDKNEVFNFVRSDQPVGLKASLVQSILNSVEGDDKAKIAAIVNQSTQPQQPQTPAPAQPAKQEAKPDNGKGKSDKK